MSYVEAGKTVSIFLPPNYQTLCFNHFQANHIIRRKTKCTERRLRDAYSAVRHRVTTTVAALIYDHSVKSVALMDFPLPPQLILNQSLMYRILPPPPRHLHRHHLRLRKALSDSDRGWSTKMSRLECYKPPCGTWSVHSLFLQLDLFFNNFFYDYSC